MLFKRLAPPCLIAGFVNITDQNHDTSSHSGRMRGDTNTQKMGQNTNLISYILKRVNSGIAYES